jgi:hypothetical protein
MELKQHNERLPYDITKDAQGKIHSERDIRVLFIQMTGRVQQGR